VKRSVENAIVRPSGDQAGWRSANASDERTNRDCLEIDDFGSLKPLKNRKRDLPAVGDPSG
jgi:hypothetical protein